MIKVQVKLNTIDIKVVAGCYEDITCFYLLIPKSSTGIYLSELL